MEWFSWLIKTGLHPSLAYDYALTFSRNQLEEDDVSYFSHELLQSMGISVAKHRLQILKLARKERPGRNSMYPLVWFNIVFQRTIANIKKTRNSAAANHIRGTGQQPQADLTTLRLPQRNHSLRWKVAMLQRSKILKAPCQPEWVIMPDGCVNAEEYDYGRKILMLTNGSSSSIRTSSSSEEMNANYEQANPSYSSFSSGVYSVDGENWSCRRKQSSGIPCSRN